jgi:carbamoyltransferase
MKIIGISGLNNSIRFKQRMFPGLSKRQYRLAQGADAAAALIIDGKIKAAAAEERFTGDKGTHDFPINAIRSCLHSGGLTTDAVDYIAHNFDYEPFRDYFVNDDYGKQQFDEVYSRQALVNCLVEYLPASNWADKLVQVPHHLAHAASAFYPSGFDEALILVADGIGEFHSTTIAIGNKDKIEIIRQVPGLHSLGILYGIFTLYLGFYMNFDEYKVMGLAPYGNRRRYFSKMMQLVDLKEDGTYTTPLLFYNKTIEEQETYSGTLRFLTEMFGPPREPGSELTQHHIDLAAALQATLEACLTHVLRYFKQETAQDRLCMAGGVALNCTANGVIKRSGLFEDMFIQPAAGDDGTALGAALYVDYTHEPGPGTRSSLPPAQKMALPLWGPAYDDEAIRRSLESRQGCEFVAFARFEDLIQSVVERIARGEIVAWFQGPMEFGPRALGNRSILADPRRADMRDRINSIVKKRESFRPFAPAVTAEAASRYFDIEVGDEALYSYMLLVTQVREAYREQLPAITHVDGSARVQTVFREENEQFWSLLNSFGKRTGLPVLLNTSFNVRGQPIICTPGVAIDTFLSIRLDALAIGCYVVENKHS